MAKFTEDLPYYGDSSAIEVELARIIEAPPFDRSPVMCGLLSYLVEQTLAGNGNRMKAYTIAVDALGRDADFDARTDSYPRVQVGRLRKLLDDFYAENGTAAADLRIHIPKGAYVVRFDMPLTEVESGRIIGETVSEIPSDLSVSVAQSRSIGDLGRFAAAAFVAALIGLAAWQALGGLASADVDGADQLSSVQTGERVSEYRRCTKVIAPDRCREMLGRSANPAGR